ncbi:hypothetical protein L596_020954 [Steinernema carpocapsae]|uniref:7TM GPCR serpentine receptor class x (Srx) domain-containing protein n=1 Tax=Steinernema carpocapsae TaxID=34508 RepID=A0A4U5MV24_STECR|nr:hypothetical protein L596_020954 [Steinernema carpocapsae]
MDLSTTIAGYVFLIFSVIVFGLNGLLLWILVKHKEFSARTYTIMKSICVATMAEALALGFGGVAVIMVKKIPLFLEKIFGAFVIAGWIQALALYFTLSLDRFLFLCLFALKWHL